MVKVNLKKGKKSSLKITKVLGLGLLVGSLASCGSNVEYETTEVLDPTQGIVTTVKEMEADRFRITDEEIVATVADSRIIAQYMDGEIDTFTLQEAQLVDADDGGRRRSMRGVLMGGMMGYMMGKSMSTPISQGAYANTDAYNKSATKNNAFKSSATKRTVKTPKKGFGSSKSSRSYGG